MSHRLESRFWVGPSDYILCTACIVCFFAAMSVPYMLAFPAFGSLVSAVPPILVSMAGYILVFAAFLLVIITFFLLLYVNFSSDIITGWPPLLPANCTVSSFNRGQFQTAATTFTFIGLSLLPLDNQGDEGTTAHNDNDL